MSDSRPNPVVHRFPPVRGFEGAAPQVTRAPFSGTSGNLGWEDVPMEEEPATFDTMTPFGFSGSTSRETLIPADRHSRGLDSSVTAAPRTDRVRENVVGDMPLRQVPNREGRMFGECSRRIAQKDGQAVHDAWKSRVSSDCSACRVPGQ